MTGTRADARARATAYRIGFGARRVTGGPKARNLSERAFELPTDVIRAMSRIAPEAA